MRAVWFSIINIECVRAFSSVVCRCERTLACSWIIIRTCLRNVKMKTKLSHSENPVLLGNKRYHFDSIIGLRIVVRMKIAAVIPCSFVYFSLPVHWVPLIASSIPSINRHLRVDQFVFMSSNDSTRILIQHFRRLKIRLDCEL